MGYLEFMPRKSDDNPRGSLQGSSSLQSLAGLGPASTFLFLFRLTVCRVVSCFDFRVSFESRSLSIGSLGKRAGLQPGK